MAKVQLTQTQRKLRDFSDWVGGRLRDNGQKQGDLATYLGIHPSGISMKLRGRTPWSLEEYYQIQEFFGEEYR